MFLFLPVSCIIHGMSCRRQDAVQQSESIRRLRRERVEPVSKEALTRDAAREIAMHFVFEMMFTGTPAEELLQRELQEEAFEQRSVSEPLYDAIITEERALYIRTVVTQVWAHSDELDDIIKRHAKGWRLNRIDRVAVAMMRVCLCEILYIPDIPIKASINEAVEILKGYVDPDVVKFVNGILGAAAREHDPNVDKRSKRAAGKPAGKPAEQPKEQAAKPETPAESVQPAEPVAPEAPAEPATEAPV